MTNEEFIRLHREEDVRRLALTRAPEGVDLKWCLQQIEGWQIARRKLPSWAATEGLWYPARLSMEQCSSEETARYKRGIVERLIPEGRTSMVDLTGGLGVDFSQLAPLFREATYVEVQPQLIELAQHNFPLLGIEDATCTDHSSFLLRCSTKASLRAERFTLHSSLFFIDPARRDGVGRKTVSIQDCTPNLLEMQDELLANSQWVMVKLSPMLDITQALRELHGVKEVHVVSVQGECKELLMVMKAGEEGPVTMHCVNLGTDDDEVTITHPDSNLCSSTIEPKVLLNKASGSNESNLRPFLYEPNASILKAGVCDALTRKYPIAKLHARSNLFVSEQFIPHFPGRRFRIKGVSDFGKRNLKALIGDLEKANLTVRNFPTSVEKLRRQLHLAEGGETYLFATTLSDGQHALIRCEKA
ncbi:MAG: hypothetical protein J6Y04_08875 [Bacteroidaceae bacterium]|nr:hypothetical protein [Bacteroidaceae bacterium]